MLLQFKLPAKTTAPTSFNEATVVDIIRKYMRAMNVELASTCGVQIGVNVNKMVSGSGVLERMTLTGTIERTK